MESNKTLKSLRDVAERELDELAKKGTLNPPEVEAAKNTVCLIKEIDELCRRDEWKDESSGCFGNRYYPPYSYGYSYGWNGPYEMNQPGRMYSYDDGTSMARGRDAMAGRYISRGDDMDTSGRRYSYNYSYGNDGMNTSGRRYSYGNDINTSGRRMYGSFSYEGRSGHSIEDRVIDRIEGMMDEAKSNYERERLNYFIRLIDSMKGE